MELDDLFKLGDVNFRMKHHALDDGGEASRRLVKRRPATDGSHT